MRNPLLPQEGYRCFNGPLGLFVPVGNLFVGRELVMYITSDISAPDCQKALKNTIRIYLSEPKPTQRLGNRRRTAWITLTRKKRMKDLATAYWFTGGVDPVENLPQN